MGNFICTRRRVGSPLHESAARIFFWGEDQLQVVKMFLLQSTPTWVLSQNLRPWDGSENPLKQHQFHDPQPQPRKLQQNSNQVTCSRNVAVESIAQKLSGLEESMGCEFQEVVNFRSRIGCRCIHKRVGV